MTNANSSGEMPDNPVDAGAAAGQAAGAAADQAGAAGAAGAGVGPEADASVDGAGQAGAEQAAGAAADGAAGAGGAGQAGAGQAGAGASEDLAAQLAERTEDLQRVNAEYANYRRRAERDRTAAIESAKAQIASDLLPIVDDLDLAESHGDLTGPLKAMHDKLHGVLRGAKVEVFGAEGDAFDPELHEAVQDTSSGEDKALGTVLRKGYRMGDRVLRHAMVIIADPQ